MSLVERIIRLVPGLLGISSVLLILAAGNLFFAAWLFSTRHEPFWALCWTAAGIAFVAYGVVSLLDLGQVPCELAQRPALGVGVEIVLVRGERAHQLRGLRGLDVPFREEGVGFTPAHVGPPAGSRWNGWRHGQRTGTRGRDPARGCGRAAGPFGCYAARRSCGWSHWTRPVYCIMTNRVRIAPIVIASPVNPSQKNVYENSTR